VQKTSRVAVLMANVEVAAAVGNDASAASDEQDSMLQEGAIVKIQSVQSAAAQQNNGAKRQNSTQTVAGGRPN
jgi:hypothetical protein